MHLISLLGLQLSHQILIGMPMRRFFGILFVALGFLALGIAEPVGKGEGFRVDFGGSTRLGNIILTEEGKGGLYVDIGAFDPVYLSNTLELQMAGWNGINVEPNHERILKFISMRPRQVNLNLAIRDPSSVATFYSMKQGQQSTFAPTAEESKNTMSNTVMPTISLKELCERYYQVRPTIINIGFDQEIQKIIEGNLWSQPMCVPDIFVLANRRPLPTGKVQTYQLILTSMKYTKFLIDWTGVQVFIKDDAIEKYRKSHIESLEAQKAKKTIKFEDILSQFSLLLNKKIDQKLYQSQIGLSFAKNRQVIDVDSLIHKSHQQAKRFQDKLLPKEPRPIILFNFKLKENSLILRNCAFSIEKILTPKIEFYNLTVFSASDNKKQRTSIYILDYKEGENLVPKIVVLEEYCQEDGGTGKFVATGSYQTPNPEVSLGDYILQILFTVTFLTTFLVFSIILLFYLCKSLKNQMKLQQTILHFTSQRVQQSQMSTST